MFFNGARTLLVVKSTNLRIADDSSGNNLRKRTTSSQRAVATSVKCLIKHSAYYSSARKGQFQFRKTLRIQENFLRTPDHRGTSLGKFQF